MERGGLGLVRDPDSNGDSNGITQPAHQAHRYHRLDEAEATELGPSVVVRDCVLASRGHLSQGLVLVVRYEDRVVAESCRTAGGACQRRPALGGGLRWHLRGADGNALEAAQHEQRAPGRRGGQLNRRVPPGQLLDGNAALQPGQ